MNKYDEVKPLEGFDWEAFESGAATPKEEAQELREKYSRTIENIEPGQVVEGKVVSITKREVTVSVGLKTNGIIPYPEFRYNPDLAVGDTVEVIVKEVEDKTGHPVLSHKEAMQIRAWDRINEAFEKKETVKGYIESRTRGGMLVEIMGIQAFLPGSQIDIKPISDFDLYVGRTMEFRIVKVKQEFLRNVVVSHKILIEEELEAQRAEIISHLEKGQVLEGTVKNITSYGAFIDLGGVDGLVHITDLSWGRVKHPEEVLEINQKINVVILDFDEERRRIALGLKQLTPHPWDSLDPDLKVGDKIRGTVVVLMDYGAFVEVVPGVEGLIHVSEMSWTQHVRSASDVLSVGQEVEAVILSLDREDRKMSLGMKQLMPDPWETIEERYPVGSRHTAKVHNFTNFGIFVEFPDGIDGLVHISDLSWTQKIKHPSDFTTKGADMDVIVLEIDKENRRLSLGHKQIEEDPWQQYAGSFVVGSIHDGKIIEMVEKGAVVALEGNIPGFATPKHLVKEDGTPAQVGENLRFKVIDFNRDSHRIILSHSRIHEDAKRNAGREERKMTEESVKTVNTASQSEKSTLGDLNVLANLREKLAEEESKDADK